MAERGYLKRCIFWDITLFNSLKDSRISGGIYRLHLQGWRISQAMKLPEAGSKQNNPLAENSGLYEKETVGGCMISVSSHWLARRKQ
jgi:hypothetical protein